MVICGGKHLSNIGYDFFLSNQSISSDEYSKTFEENVVRKMIILSY